MKNLLDLLSNYFEITGNGIYDAILITVVGSLVFRVAYKIVGKISDDIDIHNSTVLSVLHWAIRIPLFLIAIVFFIFIFKYINWLLFIPWWVYLIIAIVIILIGGLIIFFFVKRRRKCSVENNDLLKNKESQVETAIEKDSDIRNVANDEIICPKCGGKLVVRKGPYGSFYGCENYSRGCNYTRSIKKI